MFNEISLETGDFLVDETFEFVSPVVGLQRVDDKAGLIELAAAKVGDRPLFAKEGELVRIVGARTDSSLMSISSVRIADASGDQVGFIVGGINIQGWR